MIPAWVFASTTIAKPASLLNPSISFWVMAPGNPVVPSGSPFRRKGRDLEGSAINAGPELARPAACLLMGGRTFSWRREGAIIGTDGKGVATVTDTMSSTASEARQPYLKIENVNKKFGDFAALTNISLEIYDGEFICFLGPSGCGKTTLLRAIAGLDIQTSGRIKQAGRDISALPPSERDFGIVFQSYALFPNLTVFKNVAYGLENRKMAKADVNARVDELLQLVGMPDQGNKYPAQLSGGEQQRVALSRALATSPGLLLLDEPLSALDAKVRVRLRHEVKQLHDRRRPSVALRLHRSLLQNRRSQPLPQFLPNGLAPVQPLALQ